MADGAGVGEFVPARRCMAVALAAALGLGGCADGAAGLLGPAGGEPAGDVQAARSTELVETDVEAPEVFQVTEEGLWDGRPSLGGVWVAHPDVTDPERVIIRNQANGSFVIGALFRRERDNPGPALQVSSDAAEALQLLAGAPATLNVTALRREEAAAPAPTEAAMPQAVAPSPAEGLAETEALAAPAVEATALAPAAIETTALDAPLPVEAAAEAAAPSEPVDPAIVEAVATTTTAIVAAAALPPEAAPEAAPDAAIATSMPDTAVSSLDRPFIQLGIFSIEANADATAAAMTAQGLPARVTASTTQGADFWRVLVGPAATEAARASLLDQVKSAGFDDAYFVSN